MRAKQLQVRNSDKLRIAPTTEWQPACVPCTEEARSFHSAYLVYHDVVQRDWLSGLLRSCCCTYAECCDVVSCVLGQQPPPAAVDRVGAWQQAAVLADSKLTHSETASFRSTTA